MSDEKYGHIHPEFRHIACLSMEERLNFLDQPRWIGYSAAHQILDTLQGLMRKPKQPRMPNLLIVGDSNQGKTTLIRRFYELCGTPYINDEADPIKPVIVADASSTADEKRLYCSILERFHAPYRATDPTTKLLYQVIHLLRECQVKILAIDEFHSLLTGSAIKQREVMNAIKLLCNELAIPIVGVGTRDAVRVLHTDPQHASRFDVVQLPRWELNKQFQSLLVDFESVLPLKRPSQLHKRELAKLLYSISEGNLGNLHRLVTQCAGDAIRIGQEQITQEIIKGNKWLQPTRGIREVML